METSERKRQNFSVYNVLNNKTPTCFGLHCSIMREYSQYCEHNPNLEAAPIIVHIFACVNHTLELLTQRITLETIICSSDFLLCSRTHRDDGSVVSEH